MRHHPQASVPNILKILPAHEAVRRVSIQGSLVQTPGQKTTAQKLSFHSFAGHNLFTFTFIWPPKERLGFRDKTDTGAQSVAGFSPGSLSQQTHPLSAL